MARLARLVLLVTVVATLAACSPGGSPSPGSSGPVPSGLATGLPDLGSPGTRYTGLVAFGFELEAFGPCGQAEQWWVAAKPLDLADRYRAAAGFEYRPVYVVIEGTISDKGHFGQAGSYDREIRISRLVEMDPARKSC